MSPLINTQREPWHVTITGIGRVDIASDGTTLITDCLDSGAERILREHVGAPLSAWRKGSWLVNGALMRASGGEVVLIAASLESWYPALTVMLERGWSCLADRLVEITVHDGHVQAVSQGSGATIPRLLAEAGNLVVAHPARPGSDSVELHPPAIHGDHTVSALVIVETRLESAPEAGLARARAVRNLLAMPELRPTSDLADAITSLCSLPFRRLPSIFQPQVGDERDLGTRARDTLVLLETWLQEVAR